MLFNSERFYMNATNSTPANPGNVWQLAAPCSPANWLIVQQQATEAGWTVEEDGGITQEWFNPLTDSNVVCEVHYHEGSVWTELRDHDGAGDMIPHTVVVDYHSDREDGGRDYFTSFVFHEMVAAFLEYCNEQTKKYDVGFDSQPGHAEMIAWIKSDKP